MPDKNSDPVSTKNIDGSLQGKIGEKFKRASRFRKKDILKVIIYEESFSDLAIITVHYPERFEVDEIREAFVKAHPRRLFKVTFFD